MGKLRENGLLVNPRWHDSPFSGIFLGAGNTDAGVSVANPLMMIQVAVNPTANETFGIGTKTYTFKGSGAVGDQINLGATIPLTVTAIINKINLDCHNGTGCTAYPLGAEDLLVLVDNEIESHHHAPAFTDDVGKVIEHMEWRNEINQAYLNQKEYFKIDNVHDVDAKPIVLVERNSGTYQNFLYALLPLLIILL